MLKGDLYTMDKIFSGMGQWFEGIVTWAIHQPWLMEMIGAGVLVMFIIAIFSDEN